MQLARGIASTGTKVFVMVLDSVNAERPEEGTAEHAKWKTERDEWEAEKANNIFIMEASKAQGTFTPLAPSSELASVTHIVGHAHITGKDAAKLRILPQLKNTKLWQVNHVLPREADLLKDYKTAQEREKHAKLKEAEINNLNAKADHVFSVGPEMHEHYRRYLPESKHTELILPLNPDFVADAELTQRKSFGRVVNILYIGRVEEVLFLKGMDIAVGAAATADNNDYLKTVKKTVQLTVVGATNDSEAETRARLSSFVESYARDLTIVINTFATPAEVRGYLKDADIFIMPSRIEPFGLVAMEAIACGVPTLVTSNSGVAVLLQDYYSDLCVKTSVSHPAEVQQEKNFKADCQAWSEAIIRLIQQDKAAFARALRLREDMMKIVSPYEGFVKQGNEGAAL